MTNQFTQGNIQIKTSLLIFLKGSVAPIVLYLEDPKKVYDDLQKVLKAASAPKMLELDALGPIKKVSLVSTEISGLALQEEQYMVKQ